MNQGAVLITRRLRALTTHAQPGADASRPLSAASGLVCHRGRAYVVADDEQHLAVFSDATTPGRRFRLLAGGLPAAVAARKRRKADLESLLLFPPVPGQVRRTACRQSRGARACTDGGA